MKIWEIKGLINCFGGETTLNDVLKKIQANKIYKCPKCNGSGIVTIKYDAYPKGLPDSGFVEDWREKHVECDLCHGHGYTENEYVAKIKTIQEGWEVKQ